MCSESTVFHIPISLKASVFLSDSWDNQLSEAYLKAHNINLSYCKVLSPPNIDQNWPLYSIKGFHRTHQDNILSGNEVRIILQ